MKLTDKQKGNLTAHVLWTVTWLSLRWFYMLFYVAVVFCMTLPVFIILSQILDGGQTDVFKAVTYVLFLPLSVQGQTSFEGDDFLLIAAFWSAVIAIALMITRKIKGKNTKPTGISFKVVKRGYMLTYLVAFLLIPFIPMADGSSRVGFFFFVLVFFITGYIFMWFARVVKLFIGEVQSKKLLS